MRVVVRGFGYKVMHFADIKKNMIGKYAWPGPKHTFDGLAKPIAALCGNEVRSCQDVVVIMDKKVKANCRMCLRLEQRGF